MATFNGTLKYKQDDGSIAELNPVGVDNKARASANSNANAIGTWVLNNPISSIAGVIGKWDMTHDSGENITDVLAGIASDLSNEVTARKNADTALDTRVTKLENAAFKSQYFFPAFGTVIESTASSVTVAFPMPEELYNILGSDSGFSTVLAVVQTRTAGGSSTVAYCATRTTEQALVAFVVDGKHLSVNKEMGYLYATFNTGTQNATKCIGMPVVPFRDESFYSVPYISVTLS